MESAFKAVGSQRQNAVDAAVKELDTEGVSRKKMPRPKETLLVDHIVILVFRSSLEAENYVKTLRDTYKTLKETM